MMLRIGVVLSSCLLIGASSCAASPTNSAAESTVGNSQGEAKAAVSTTDTTVEPSTSASANRSDVAVGDVTLRSVYSPDESLPETIDCGEELSLALGYPAWGLCLESWGVAMGDACLECEGMLIMHRVDDQWSQFGLCYIMAEMLSEGACQPDFPPDVSPVVRCAVYPDNSSLVNLSRSECLPRAGELERIQVDACPSYFDYSTSILWGLGRSVLEVCQKGPWVAKLQQALIALGYPLKSDGLFDSMTARAVIDVQLANGLVVSGVGDEPTLELLLGTSALS